MKSERDLKYDAFYLVDTSYYVYYFYELAF